MVKMFIFGKCYGNFSLLLFVEPSQATSPWQTVVHGFELPQAFQDLWIEKPECPCATQETDPAIQHYYHIWVVQSGQLCGKVAAACAQNYRGCGTFGKFLLIIDEFHLLTFPVCLTDLIQENPELLLDIYAVRPDGETGPGKFGQHSNDFIS